MNAREELQKAYDALTKFQAWRTGEDERTMDEAGIEPSEVRYALKVRHLVKTITGNKKGT